MSLSVCLLTRNEEKNISRAVRSVAGIADQVVVADTGSTDRTMQVAMDLGAKVYGFAWNDDFAAGRDFTIHQATGDWILWLNPDEELLASSHGPLRASLARDDAFAFYVRVRDLLRAAQPDVFTESMQLRLFRKHRDLRSIGRLHPSYVPSLEELARREQKLIPRSDVTLQRHGYLSELTEPKLRWAARLLQLELRDRPGQLHYLIEYGRTLLLLNDANGHFVLAQAVEQILPVRDAPSAPLPEVQRLLEYLLTVKPELSRSRLTRAEARELALHWFPNSPPLLWRIAENYFQEGEFRPAAELLEKLVQLARSASYDSSESFDPSILGDRLLMNLGACYTRLRDLDKAESCFLQLLNGPTSHAQAEQNLAVVQSLRVQTAAPDEGKSF